MRILSTLVISSFFALPLMVAACGGDDGGGEDADPFNTFQDCWNEHHVMESLSVQQAIVTCCNDHPIGNNAAHVVCGSTEDSCETYVDANLDSSDATTDDITAACQAYVAANS
jgi:hypothetical protein